VAAPPNPEHIFTCVVIASSAGCGCICRLFSRPLGSLLPAAIRAVGVAYQRRRHSTLKIRSARACTSTWHRQTSQPDSTTFGNRLRERTRRGKSGRRPVPDLGAPAGRMGA
jgi:hypothetical protein